MEFKRFGSTIPGEYWGCCACSILQDFNQDPDDPYSSQVQYGDEGNPANHPETAQPIWVGPTYRDIFWQRMRIGEFNTNDMPNHSFIAIITGYQASIEIGMKWLALLKEAGFEFLRAADNSVYGGTELYEEGKPSYPHVNYYFGLFRNVGSNTVKDQFTPPSQWTDLPHGGNESWPLTLQTISGEDLTKEHRIRQRQLWDALPPKKFLTEEEVVAAGAPVMLCGLRQIASTYEEPDFPPQSKEERDEQWQAVYDAAGKYLEGKNKVEPEAADPFAAIEDNAVPVISAQGSPFLAVE